MRYAYEFASDQICAALARLFGLPNIHPANPVAISQAIDWHRKGLDFTDALHLANNQQQRQLFTFSQRFISKARGRGRRSVLQP